MYETEKGVSADLVQAYMWYSLSALHGSEQAPDQMIK